MSREKPSSPPVFLFTLTWLSPSHFWHRMCGDFPQNKVILWCQLGVLRFNSTLTLSTWRWPQIPQVRGSVLKDRPSPLQIPTTSWDCHLASNRLAITHRCRADHRTQENSLLIVYLLKTQMNMRRCIGQGVWEGVRSLHALPMCHSPSTCTCSPTWELSKPLLDFGIFMEASSHRHDRWIINSISNSVSEEWGRRVEAENLKLLFLVFFVTSPYLGAHKELPHLEQKTLISPWKFQGI